MRILGRRFNLPFETVAIQMTFWIFQSIDNLPIPTEDQTMLFVSIFTEQFFRTEK